GISSVCLLRSASRLARKRTVTVKMHKGYRYARQWGAASIRNSAVDALKCTGAGKYMTECRREFPRSWFADAQLSPRSPDRVCNFFGVEASQSLSEWKRKG